MGSFEHLVCAVTEVLEMAVFPTHQCYYTMPCPPVCVVHVWFIAGSAHICSMAYVVICFLIPNLYIYLHLNLCIPKLHLYLK